MRGSDQRALYGFSVRNLRQKRARKSDCGCEVFVTRADGMHTTLTLGRKEDGAPEQVTFDDKTRLTLPASEANGADYRVGFQLAQFVTTKGQVNKMQKITALVLLALCTAGCTTAGTKADPDIIASFQPGVTTLEQAEARLGQPSSVSKTSDGSTIVAYEFTQAQAGGSSHKPFIDTFFDHSDANTDVVVLSFGKASKFDSSTLTQSTASDEMFKPQ
jgi:hypothetical protein